MTVRNASRKGRLSTARALLTMTQVETSEIEGLFRRDIPFRSGSADYLIRHNPHLTGLSTDLLDSTQYPGGKPRRGGNLTFFGGYLGALPLSLPDLDAVLYCITLNVLVTHGKRSSKMMTIRVLPFTSIQGIRSYTRTTYSLYKYSLTPFLLHQSTFLGPHRVYFATSYVMRPPIHE